MKKMLSHPLILLLTVCLYMVGSSYAAASNQSQDELRLQKQREIFLAAEIALEKDEASIYQQLREKLVDYPLLPYLEYQEILATLDQHSTSSITNQLQRFEGTPLKVQLRNHWLALLAKEKLWSTYLLFAHKGGSVIQQCNRLQALIETGQDREAFKAVEPIWLSGRPRPKACDPVFERWISSGHLKEKLVWQRISLAMSARQIRLARYLKRYLSQSESKLAERWLRLYKHPEEIETLFKIKHPMRNEIAAQTIRRLALQDLDAAFSAWEKFQKLTGFSDRQQRKIVYTLASRLARQPNKKTSQRLNNLLPSHLRLDNTLSQRELQAALQEKDWQWVAEIIEALPPKEQQQEQWRYWRSRALIELGRKQEGIELLQSLSLERSYYGFLAAQRLGGKPKLSHVALQSDQLIVLELAQRPGLQRARELILLDRPLQARQEWNLALRKAGKDELKAAAHLAQQWSWPSQSIITLARLHQWNDLELRFPLAHRQAVADQAKDNGIDTAWIYAILRQESAFISDAKSSAGARGLMQLMPKTAKQVAKELKHSPVDLNDLYSPEVNIKLGTGYLNKIYRQLQENPVLATAAYNAGPSRVLSWLPEQPQASDIWIETVPFRETREYLKHVFAYTVIYSFRLGDAPISLPLKWLEPIGEKKINQGNQVNSTSGV